MPHQFEHQLLHLTNPAYQQPIDVQSLVAVHVNLTILIAILKNLFEVVDCLDSGVLVFKLELLDGFYIEA